MSRRIFICSGVDDNLNVISDEIYASNSSYAGFLFKKKFNVFPKTILGPYKESKNQAVENCKVLFTGKPLNKVYNNYNVTVFKLQNMNDYVYILFNERIDGKKTTIPKPRLVPKFDVLGFNDE